MKSLMRVCSSLRKQALWFWIPCFFATGCLIDSLGDDNVSICFVLAVSMVKHLQQLPQFGCHLPTLLWQLFKLRWAERDLTCQPISL
ncbi:gsr1101 [Gloeobacter violaceus PCC 7421]|uniref:Gsr1101 protein n=1 Tax=Gloeobacter violaceus (strain ATCC 29082 / PCC 7421) TaxID=251221 RepID=Q7NLM1_GLOVI|nr:gsr1101 [Gloeobacter violaceus PCC 7421]